MGFKRLLFIFLGTLLCSSLQAQQYNVITYSIESGLPQSDIRDIYQDSRGYLWLGTNGGGVCRFDGKEFTVFNKKRNLAGNIVRTILEDKDHNLWFGTDEGITIYDGYTFTNLKREDGLNCETIIKLMQDSRGFVWAGTSSGGLIQIKYTNKKIELDSITVDNGLLGNTIFDIYEDYDHNLWVAAFGGGINVLTFRNDTVFSMKDLYPPEIATDNILTLSGDADNNIWVGTYGWGAFKIYTSGADSGSVENFKLINQTIWDIHCDKAGNLWFATDVNGVICQKEKGMFYLNTSNGLPNNQILNIYEDSENNVWIGTMGNGLCRYLGEKFVHFGEAEGLSKNHIYDIEQDKHGDFWLASFGGGLKQLKVLEDTIIQHSYTIQDGLSSNLLTSLYIDNHDNIWIGTGEKGFCKFDKTDFTCFQESDGLIFDEITTIFYDSREILWCGTVGGISLYDGTNFINFDQDDGLIHNEVQTIIEDSEGLVWFGTYGGLAWTDGQTMTDFNEEEGLYDKIVFSLVEDKFKNIWIGTFGGGLYRYNFADTSDKPIQFIADDSLLSSNNIMSLVFEDDYTLIVGTNKGFDKVNLDHKMNIKSIRSFDETNGFIGVENKQNSIYKDNKGNIWFGTVKGVTKYSPTKDFVNNKPPTVHITSIKLFFEEINWKTKADSISPWFNLPNDLSLKYNDNHLTFTFSGLSFTNPAKVKFRYMLEGLEEDWSPVRKENEAVYPSLSPGSYTFKVQAVNENGTWTTEPASFSFTIEPPFWMRAWFIITCIVVIIILIVTYIKSREKKLVRDKKILEQKVIERTAQIAKQNKELEAQRDEIEIQKDKIEDQLKITSRQKDLISEQQQEILDSIKYAKRIQTAILPPEESTNKDLPEHFILFRPKDIVSGDFHWSSVKDNKLVICAADCTGHGVPGAFMSMLGVSFMNQIVNEKGVTEPHTVLNLLREDIINALQQKGQEGEAKDGMDMALCSIDLSTNKMQFAGANNPLYFIRNGELEETKGDKMPVAIHVRMDPFNMHEFDLLKGDMIYLFSDGYADQFGGPKGKKFKYKQLKDILLELQSTSMLEQKTILNQRIEDWMVGPDVDEHHEQIDDIVIIGIRI